uniref:Uncharacterized protein n=1 Tax=Strongyloides venezuelensis TaxID=75913 RepID=A0A0K0G2F3_STRVS
MNQPPLRLILLKTLPIFLSPVVKPYLNDIKIQTNIISNHIERLIRWPIIMNAPLCKDCYLAPVEKFQKNIYGQHFSKTEPQDLDPKPISL